MENSTKYHSIKDEVKNTVFLIQLTLYHEYNFSQHKGNILIPGKCIQTIQSAKMSAYKLII